MTAVSDLDDLDTSDGLRPGLQDGKRDAEIEGATASGQNRPVSHASTGEEVFALMEVPPIAGFPEPVFGVVAARSDLIAEADAARLTGVGQEAAGSGGAASSQVDMMGERNH